MKFEYLADQTNLLPTIAEWYFEEWGFLNKEQTLNKVIENLQVYLNKDRMPLIMVAIENDEPLGAAQLKYHEMNIYPDKDHWLGGVYVLKKHRGKGIAKKLIQEIILTAKNLNIKTLYLQTEQLDGGLYTRMGWIPIEQVNYHGLDVVVMENHIKK